MLPVAEKIVLGKLDKLIIRACKSEQPLRRLRSVHRRFYINVGDSERIQYTHLASILAGLIDRVRIQITGDDFYKLVRAQELNIFLGVESPAAHVAVVEYLISRIRYTNAKALPDFGIPASLRRHILNRSGNNAARLG